MTRLPQAQLSLSLAAAAGLVEPLASGGRRPTLSPSLAAAAGLVEPLASGDRRPS